MFLRLLVSFGLLALATDGLAQEKRFVLDAPDALVETGFLQYLLPRFSLKTGVRIMLDDEGAQARLTEDTGTPVFQGAEVLWRLDHVPGPHTNRFLDWLRSDVGARTIVAFAPDGGPAFTLPVQTREVEQAVIPDADTQAGERLSLVLCGRCHVVNDKNRMKAIGSTPSFAVLRTLPGWIERFEAFYALKPHGAFTQVADVTPPFDPARPPPIAPVELTLGDLDAILAYVATVVPADLGAPIHSQ